MQFKQVAIGQQFRWRDQLYLKTSPLTATPQAGGKQKMIAQSAKVLLVGQALATPSDEGRHLQCRPEQVRAAIEQLYTAALAILAQPTDNARSREALEAARDQALASLRL